MDCPHQRSYLFPSLNILITILIYKCCDLRRSKMKLTKKEMQQVRFCEIVESRDNKIWCIDTLLERINFMLPSKVVLTKHSLVNLISNQQKFKIFKYLKQKETGGKTYYIFKKTLPD